MVRIVAHRVVHLTGEHDVVAPALECLADDLLGFALGVHVGGVDEVDPRVQALWMIRIESSWSGFPMTPNIMAPRQYGLTSIPVRPSVRYFITSPLEALGEWPGSMKTTPRAPHQQDPLASLPNPPA